MATSLGRVERPIVVVEDHADTAEMLRRYLEREGMKVVVAENAEMARLLVASYRPGCVVLDNQLPGVTGIQLLRGWRQDAGFYDLPVVFYSAAFDPATKAEAEGLGADGWFIKGVSRLSELASRVKDLSGRRRMEGEGPGKAGGYLPT